MVKNWAFQRSAIEKDQAGLPREDDMEVGHE